MGLRSRRHYNAAMTALTLVDTAQRLAENTLNHVPTLYEWTVWRGHQWRLLGRGPRPGSLFDILVGDEPGELKRAWRSNDRWNFIIVYGKHVWRAREVL